MRKSFSFCLLITLQTILIFAKIEPPAELSNYAIKNDFFIKNMGQLPPEILFYSDTKDGRIYIRENDIVFQFIERPKIEIDKFDFILKKKQEENQKEKFQITNVYVKFEGGNFRDIYPQEELITKFNFFKGTETEKWIRNVPTYKRIVIKEIFQGVDLIFDENLWHFDAIDGFDLKNIKFSFDTSKKFKYLDEAVEFETEFGIFKIPYPLIKKGDDLKILKLNENFNFEEKNLRAGQNLLWATYIGGSAFDIADYIKLDSVGDIILSGSTYSTNIPVPNGYDTTNNSAPTNPCGYLAKLSSNGNNLLWGTFIEFSDVGDIEIDSSNNIIASGGFKMTPDGQNLLWSGALTGNEIAIKSTGNIVGIGYDDVLHIYSLYELSSVNGATIWQTNIPYTYNDDSEFISYIEVDSADNIIIGGGVKTQPALIVNGYDTSFGGGLTDGFLSKFSPDGQTLLWGTYIGGTGDDSITDFVLDSSQNIIFALGTGSSGLPAQNGYDQTNNGSGDIYIGSLSSNGQNLLWGTYLGGSQWDLAWGIALDSSENIILGGYTSSTNIPTPNGFDTTFNGGTYDCYLAKLNSNGSSLLWGTYIGGADGDRIFSIELDSLENIIFGGYTYSSNIPVLNGYDTTPNGDYDIYVGKITDPLNILCNITVTFPNGGEFLNPGSNYNITWNFSGANCSSPVKIELYKGANLNSVISNSTPNTGSFLWAIPPGQAQGSDYKIRISDTVFAGLDESDNYFTIAPPQTCTFTVLFPNGGETIYNGYNYDIKWNSNGANCGSNVSIELYKGGQKYATISSSASNTGTFSWTVSNSYPKGSDYQIKITDINNLSNTDISDNLFTITNPTCTYVVNSPNGGEVWNKGAEYPISWSSNGPDCGTNVKIDLYKSGAFSSTIASSTENDGFFLWTIPNNITEDSDYKVKTTDLNNNTFFDYSNNNFTISGPACGITVTYPNGTETIYKGTPFDITWTVNGYACSPYVKIELYYGTTLKYTISSSTENDGLYNWTVPSSVQDGKNYKIKITDTSNPAYFDYSDNYFTITSVPICSIYVLFPDGGEVLYKGLSYSILWTSSGNDCSGKVGIDLYYGGNLKQTIVSSTANDGIYTWDIPFDIQSGNSYEIKIYDSKTLSYFDFSNDDFSITSYFGENLFIPAVASSRGINNTNWKTDLMAFNPFEEEICYDLIFVPKGEDGITSPVCENRCLQPKKAFYYEDVLKNVCGVEENSSGNIRFQVEKIPFVTSRTYNDTDIGTYGQFIPSNLKDNSLRFSSLRSEDYGYILGISEDKNYRTNIGFTETAGLETIIQIIAYSPSGNELGSKNVKVPPFGWIQGNWNDFGFPDISQGYAKVKLLSGGSILAYGSKVDNLTGDAIFIPLKKKSDIEGKDNQFIAVITHSEGGYGTNWRTDLWLLNTNSQEKDITLKYGVKGGEYSSSVKIKANEQIFISDVIVKLFSNAGLDTSGSLRVENGSGVIVISRTYNETEGGTYGQFIPSLSEEELLSKNGSAYILQLKCNESFRTNIGFSNFTKNDAKVYLSIYNINGKILGTKEYVILKYQNFQINNIMESFGIACSDSNYFAKVYVEDGTVFAYGSVIDNRTGDAIFIPAKK